MTQEKEPVIKRGEREGWPPEGKALYWHQQGIEYVATFQEGWIEMEMREGDVIHSCQMLLDSEGRITEIIPRFTPEEIDQRGIEEEFWWKATQGTLPCILEKGLLIEKIIEERFNPLPLAQEQNRRLLQEWQKSYPLLARWICQTLVNQVLAEEEISPRDWRLNLVVKSFPANWETFFPPSSLERLPSNIFLLAVEENIDLARRDLAVSLKRVERLDWANLLLLGICAVQAGVVVLGREPIDPKVMSVFTLAAAGAGGFLFWQREKIQAEIDRALESVLAIWSQTQFANKRKGDGGFDR